jgi:hypothetical protein
MDAAAPSDDELLATKVSGRARAPMDHIQPQARRPPADPAEVPGPLRRTAAVPAGPRVPSGRTGRSRPDRDLDCAPWPRRRVAPVPHAEKGNVGSHSAVRRVNDPLAPAAKGPNPVCYRTTTTPTPPARSTPRRSRASGASAASAAGASTTSRRCLSAALGAATCAARHSRPRGSSSRRRSASRR